MLKDSIKNSANVNYFTYFPYFNHQLYENPYDIQEEEEYLVKNENIQSSEASSTNTSRDSIDIIDNEEQFIPLNLLELSPIKTKTTFVTKENNLQITKQIFDSIDGKEKNVKIGEEKKKIQPELLKYKLPKSLFYSKKNEKDEKEGKNTPKYEIPSFILSEKINKFNQPLAPKYNIYPFITYNSVDFGKNVNQIGRPNLCGSTFQKVNIDKKKKKKKQDFVEREGDWCCYRCKNINFSFRDKCNKCQLSKGESEKKYIEVGEALLKLANISNCDKK